MQIFQKKIFDTSHTLTFAITHIPLYLRYLTYPCICITHIPLYLQYLTYPYIFLLYFFCYFCYYFVSFKILCINTHKLYPSKLFFKNNKFIHEYKFIYEYKFETQKNQKSENSIHLKKQIKHRCLFCIFGKKLILLNSV